MNNKAIIIFNITKRNFSVDLEIPLDISANDLVIALNSAYDLGISTFGWLKRNWRKTK